MTKCNMEPGDYTAINRHLLDSLRVQMARLDSLRVQMARLGVEVPAEDNNALMEAAAFMRPVIDPGIELGRSTEHMLNEARQAAGSSVAEDIEALHKPGPVEPPPPTVKQASALEHELNKAGFSYTGTGKRCDHQRAIMAVWRLLRQADHIPSVTNNLTDELFGNPEPVEAIDMSAGCVEKTPENRQVACGAENAKSERQTDLLRKSERQADPNPPLTFEQSQERLESGCDIWATAFGYTIKFKADRFNSSPEQPYHDKRMGWDVTYLDHDRVYELLRVKQLCEVGKVYAHDPRSNGGQG